MNLLVDETHDPALTSWVETANDPATDFPIQNLPFGRKLDPVAVEERLRGLPTWHHDERKGAITRRFVFADFAQAFAFMAEIAMVAERRDHHPEWSNIYNTVEITWTTHDAGGLSERDIDLARYSDVAFKRFAVRA